MLSMLKFHGSFTQNKQEKRNRERIIRIRRKKVSEMYTETKSGLLIPAAIPNELYE